MVCGEQTTGRRSAARGQTLTAGPYVPVSPSLPLSLTLALILSLSDSPGSTLCHCHSLVVSLHAGRGLSSTERRVTPGEQRQLRLQVDGFLVSGRVLQLWLVVLKLNAVLQEKGTSVRHRLVHRKTASPRRQLQRCRQKRRSESRAEV